MVEGEPSAGLGGEQPFELISPSRGPVADDAMVVETVETEEAEEVASGAMGLARRLPAPVRGLGNALDQRLSRWVRDPWRSAETTVRANATDLRRRNRETAEMLPDADVYWLHSFWQYPAVRGRARKLGARFLYDTPDAHWEPGQTPAATRTSRGVTRAYERLEKSAARRAEAFTTVADGIADLLEARFGRRPRTIRNCHDLRLDRKPESDVRAATGVVKDDFLLVMTGNLKPGTAIREAVAALRELPDRVHLAFVGRSYAADPEALAELEAEPRAHLLDPLPPTEVVEFIRSADASPILYRAITPNYLHALPNGFFHAIAAGLPILYPPLPEVKALAEKHEMGVEIDPASAGSIATGVRALLDDPDAAERYAANVEEASKLLNWEHEERVLAELLRAGT